MSDANGKLYVFKLIYLFTPHLLSANCVPDTSLRAGETEIGNDVGLQRT